MQTEVCRRFGDPIGRSRLIELLEAGMDGRVDLRPVAIMTCRISCERRS